MGKNGTNRQAGKRAGFNPHEIDERCFTRGGNFNGYLRDRTHEATDLAVRQAEQRAAFQAQHGAAVQHIRDGKPLTEHGAKLLGVAWPEK